MLKTKVYDIFMLDFCARYANTELINLFRERYILDESSPTGLRNRIQIHGLSPAGKSVGEKHQSGWRVKIKGQIFQISHIVLILHGSFPEPGQVARHGRYGRYNNQIKNIYWGFPPHADR